MKYLMKAATADAQDLERVDILCYDDDGNVIPIWGYHQRKIASIFMRNDVLDGGAPNQMFKMVFAHELFHAMSYQYGVLDQYDGDKTAADEKMARKFTISLGLGD